MSRATDTATPTPPIYPNLYPYMANDKPIHMKIRMISGYPKIGIVGREFILDLLRFLEYRVRIDRDMSALRDAWGRQIRDIKQQSQILGDWQALSGRQGSPGGLDE